MRLLQAAKCGRNAQAATRSALQRALVAVCEAAEGPTETAQLEKDSEACLLRASTTPRPLASPDPLPHRGESISRRNESHPPFHPLSPFDSSALVQTLCVTNRRIHIPACCP